MSAATDQTPLRSPWIISPARDLVLFVATPLLIVPIAWAVRTAASDAAFILLVAAFGQVGHNLPGLIRAYGDRKLFARLSHTIRHRTGPPRYRLRVCRNAQYPRARSGKRHLGDLARAHADVRLRAHRCIEVA